MFFFTVIDVLFRSPDFVIDVLFRMATHYNKRKRTIINISIKLGAARPEKGTIFLSLLNADIPHLTRRGGDSALAPLEALRGPQSRFWRQLDKGYAFLVFSAPGGSQDFKGRGYLLTQKCGCPALAHCARLPEATHGAKRAGVYSGTNLCSVALLGLCGPHNHQMTFSVQKTVSEMHWAKQVQAQ